MLKELGGHYRADRVATLVLPPGTAAPIPVEAGHRIGATRLQVTAKHIVIAHPCSIGVSGRAPQALGPAPGLAHVPEHEILGGMVDDTARDRAIYHALKAVDEVAAALQTHLIEEHGAEPDRGAAQSNSTNSLKLLRQARERLGQGLRAIEADGIAESDDISLRNR
jgi:hypothetical protein